MRRTCARSRWAARPRPSRRSSRELAARRDAARDRRRGGARARGARARLALERGARGARPLRGREGLRPRSRADRRRSPRIWSTTRADAWPRATARGSPRSGGRGGRGRRGLASRSRRRARASSIACSPTRTSTRSRACFLRGPHRRWLRRHSRERAARALPPAPAAAARARHEAQARARPVGRAAASPRSPRAPAARHAVRSVRLDARAPARARARALVRGRARRARPPRLCAENRAEALEIVRLPRASAATRGSRKRAPRELRPMIERKLAALALAALSRIPRRVGVAADRATPVGRAPRAAHDGDRRHDPDRDQPRRRAAARADVDGSACSGSS